MPCGVDQSVQSRYCRPVNASSPDNTRDRIVAAARELFHRCGYTAVGVADICAQSGVVKGSFYHFFPGKNELLAEVMRRNWQELAGWLAMRERGPAKGFEDLAALFELILAEARHTVRESGLVLGCRIGSLASELGPQDKAANEACRSTLDAWRKAMRRLVRKGQRDGSIAAGADSLAVADALLASIQGMSVIGRTLHQPAALKRIAATALQQVPQA